MRTTVADVRARRTLVHRAASFWHDALTTPGRMTAAALVALLLVVTAGVHAATTITDRQRHHEALLADIEPVANASQTLYSSLTIADSAANTAFITGGLEPRHLRDRYEQAIATSSSSIVAATQGLANSDTESVRQLAEINAQLAVYTGLVETARTNNRAGQPVGSAYLASASSLMQDTILPTAADLYDRQSSSVNDSESAWVTPPWGAFLLLAIAIAVLGALQWWLAGITRRTINPGLAVATLLVVVALLWTVVGGLLTASSNARGLSEGAAPMSELTRQRITVQKLRAQETLDLVRRTDPEGSTAERAVALAQVRGSLTGYLDTGKGSTGERTGLDDEGAVTESIRALDEWVAAQNQADSLYQQGDYQGAIRISAGQEPGQSGYAFDRLDSSMQDAIEQARDTLRTRIDDARRSAGIAPDGLVLLSTLAALAVVAGIAPRIREYL